MIHFYFQGKLFSSLAFSHFGGSSQQSTMNWPEKEQQLLLVPGCIIASLSFPAERECQCPDNYKTTVGIPTDARSTSQIFFFLFYSKRDCLW